MAKVQVSNVEIVIGEQTIKLTLDEARELLQVLEATIAPEEKETKIVERVISYPVPYPVYPRPYRWYGQEWIVTCDNTSSYKIGSDTTQPYNATLNITAKSS